MPRTLTADRSFGCEANSDVSAADEARADAREVCEAGRFLRLIEVVSEGTHSADAPLTMGEVKVLLAENLKPSGPPDGGGVRGHQVPGYLNKTYHKCMDSHCGREYHDGTMTDPDTIRRAGAKLKAIRMRLGLSLREVGRLSLKLVAERGNSEFALSRAWLTDIEKGRFVPGTFKIASLSTIYQLSIAEIHRLYGFEPGDIVKQRPLFRPPKTHLLVSVEEDDIQNGLTVDDVLAKSGIENTDLLTRVVDIWGDIPVPLLRHVDLRRYLYGYIGIEDKTMSPLLPPGTFVQIDAKQARVHKGPWKHSGSRFQFARPIYFLDIRTGYACSWIEIKNGVLELIPHPDSGVPTRTFRYPGEVDVVGRVTGVAMRITGEEFAAIDPRPRRSSSKK